MWGKGPVLHSAPSPIVLALRSPRLLSLLAVAAAGGLGLVAWRMRQTPPDPEETERARRLFLAANGRLMDGTITETRWEGDAISTPHTLVYQYRISGVTYECGQDVHALPTRVRGLRIDLPVQVRFDPRNPGDSIVVAENWSGLRLDEPEEMAAEHRGEPEDGDRQGGDEPQTALPESSSPVPGR